MGHARGGDTSALRLWIRVSGLLEVAEQVRMMFRAPKGRPLSKTLMQ